MMPGHPTIRVLYKERKRGGHTQGRTSIRISCLIISKTAVLKEKFYWKNNVCFTFLYKFCWKHSWPDKCSASYGPDARRDASMSSCKASVIVQFSQNWSVSTLKLTNNKFTENMLIGSVAVTCGQTDTHGKPNCRIFTNFRCEHAVISNKK
jgi:hypothetical protein